MTDDVDQLCATPDPISGETLKRSLDALKRAVDAVMGRPIDLRVIVGRGSGRERIAAPDAEPREEHPDDVARYAFDRLL